MTRLRIAVVSSPGWAGILAAQRILADIRSHGWAAAELVYTPAQPAGWEAARWWRSEGGETRSVESVSALLAALRRGIDLAVVLVRHLDPDATEALEIADRAGVPVLLQWQGAYPFPANGKSGSETEWNSAKG